MTRRTRRWIAAGFATLAIVALYTTRIRDGMTDFLVNYQAGQRLAAGETLYQVGDGHYMFKYLPSAALVYLPLGALPVEVAKALWFGLSLAAMAGIVGLARHMVAGRVRPIPSVVSILPIVILAKYFLHELRLGQINLFVTLVMMVAFHGLTRPGERAGLGAGAMAGCAVALKPYAALLFPYLVLKRRWRSVGGGLIVLVAALLVPAVFYGFAGNARVLQQWATTLSSSTPDLLTNNDNVSVAAFFAKWTSGQPGGLWWAAAVLGALAILMLAVIIRGRDRPDAPVLEGAMVLTLIPLVSPLGWDYTFLMALLAITVLVYRFSAFPRPARILLAVNFAVIALTLYDVLGRQAYATFMQWSVTTVNFVAIVVSLAYLRFKDVC